MLADLLNKQQTAPDSGSAGSTQPATPVAADAGAASTPPDVIAESPTPPSPSTAANDEQYFDTGKIPVRKEIVSDKGYNPGEVPISAIWAEAAVSVTKPAPASPVGRLGIGPAHHIARSLT